MEGIKHEFFFFFCFSIVLTLMQVMQIPYIGIRVTLDSSKSDLASIDADFRQSRVFMFKNRFKSIKNLS